MRSKLIWYLLSIIILNSCCQSCVQRSRSGGANDMAEERTEVAETGVALYSFNRFSFEQSLEKSVEAGARVVEGFFFHELGPEFGNKSVIKLNNSEIIRMKKMLDSSGLKMISMYVGGENKDEWKRFYEIAKILNLLFLTGEPDRDDIDFIDSLSKENELPFAIHEHARGKSQFWHPDSVLSVIKEHEYIGACADLGHWVRSGLDPIDCLKKLKGRIISIHAKDIDRVGEVDANDVRVGSGVLDYPGIMEELHTQKFEGPILIECEHDWDNNLQDVQFGIEYINRLRSGD